jgi:prevent-host-death family protein
VRAAWVARVPDGSVLRHATVGVVESVSQREMRNNSGELLRRVAEGESVLITNGGVPAAVMVPAGSDMRTRLVASGRLRAGTGLDVSALPTPVEAAMSSDDLLAEDRG